MTLQEGIDFGGRLLKLDRPRLAHNLLSRFLLESAWRGAPTQRATLLAASFFATVAAGGVVDADAAKAVMGHFAERKGQIDGAALILILTALTHARQQRRLEIAAILQDLETRLRRNDAAAAKLRDTLDPVTCATIVMRLHRLGLKHTPHRSVPFVRYLVKTVSKRSDEVSCPALVQSTWASEALLGVPSASLSRVTVWRLCDADALGELDLLDLSMALQVLEHGKVLAIKSARPRARAHGGSVGHPRTAPAGGAPDETQPARARRAQVQEPRVLRKEVTLALRNVLLRLRPFLQSAAARGASPRARLRRANGKRRWADGTLDLRACTHLLFNVVRFSKWPEAQARNGRQLSTVLRLLLEVAWPCLEDAKGARDGAWPSVAAVEVQTLLWVAASMPNEVPEERRAAVADVLAPLVPALSAVQVSHCFWAVSELDLRHPQLMVALAAAARTHVTAFNPKALAVIAHSMARLTVHDDWLLELLGHAMMEQLERAPHHIRPHDAVRIMHAFSVYKRYPEALVNGLMKQRILQTSRSKDGTTVMAAASLSVLADAWCRFFENCPTSRAQVMRSLEHVNHLLTSVIEERAISWSSEQLLPVRHLAVLTEDYNLLLETSELLDRLRGSSQQPDGSERNTGNANAEATVDTTAWKDTGT